MTKLRLFIFSLIIVFQTTIVSYAQDSDSIEQIEVREDSIKLAKAYQMQASFLNHIDADAETTPVESFNGEDAADDPAIWVNRKNPEKSLILGTNKKAGIYVYNLKGEVLQFIRCGRINNVDLRDNFYYNRQNVVLVAASNRSLNVISLFVLNKKTGILSDTIANIISGVDEVYGICMHYNKISKQFFAIVNGKGGKIEQWEIISDKKGIKTNLLRSFSVATQPEGMVVDDANGILYLGVEDEGIYAVNLNSGSFNLSLIEGSTHMNPFIVYDIEGLALLNYKNSSYLIASIQGNFTYAIFNTNKNCKYIGSFAIVPGEIDGVEETDGIEMTNLACGKKYPDGILVVQDGFNSKANKPENQNFKIVSLSKILPFLE